MSQANHSPDELKGQQDSKEKHTHIHNVECNINVDRGESDGKNIKNIREYLFQQTQCLINMERNVIVYTNFKNIIFVLILAKSSLSEELDKDQSAFLNQITLLDQDDLKSTFVVLDAINLGNSIGIQMIEELAFALYRSLSLHLQISRITSWKSFEHYSISNEAIIKSISSWLGNSTDHTLLPPHPQTASTRKHFCPIQALPATGLHPIQANLLVATCSSHHSQSLLATDNVRCHSYQEPSETRALTSKIKINQIIDQVQFPIGSFDRFSVVCSSRTLQDVLGTSLILSERETQLLLSENVQVLNGKNTLVRLCAWVMDEEVFSLLFQIHFDLFFTFCTNAIECSCESFEFAHLPFVPGELITIQSLLLDASYCHKSNYAFFLKVAFRAEVAICYILPHGEALQFYRYCVEVAVDNGDEVAEARMLIVYGQLLGRCKEYLGLAYQQFRRALRLLEPRGKCIDLAWLLTATGWNLFSRGLTVGGKV